MANNAAFAGLGDAPFDFLKKLAKNNRREWFQPRKAVFEEQVQTPMKQLMLAIEDEMKKAKLPLRVNPKAMISRIYRDIRFREDKTPYNTFLGGALYRDGKKGSPGVLYVHLTEKEAFTAVGFWQPERPALTNWRLRMREDPKDFLAVLKKLKSKKLALSDSHRLQRMPRGFESAEGMPIGEFLRYQSFVISRPLVEKEARSADLPKLVARFAMDAKPLLDYGWGVPEVKGDFLEERE